MPRSRSGRGLLIRLCSWQSEITRTFAGDSRIAEKHRRQYFKGKSAEHQYFHEHYQVHVRARDEYGESIDDYFLNFMPQWKTSWPTST